MKFELMKQYPLIFKSDHVNPNGYRIIVEKLTSELPKISQTQIENFKEKIQIFMPNADWKQLMEYGYLIHSFVKYGLNTNDIWTVLNILRNVCAQSFADVLFFILEETKTNSVNVASAIQSLSKVYKYDEQTMSSRACKALRDIATQIFKNSTYYDIFVHVIRYLKIPLDKVMFDNVPQPFDLFEESISNDRTIFLTLLLQHATKTKLFPKPEHLQLAIDRNDALAVKELVRYVGIGPNCTITTRSGSFTALEYAINHGDEAIVQTLLASGASIYTSKMYEKSPYMRTKQNHENSPYTRTKQNQPNDSISKYIQLWHDNVVPAQCIDMIVNRAQNASSAPQDSTDETNDIGTLDKLPTDVLIHIASFISSTYRS